MAIAAHLVTAGAGDGDYVLEAPIDLLVPSAATISASFALGWRGCEGKTGST